MTLRPITATFILAGALCAADTSGTRGIVPEEVLKARPAATPHAAAARPGPVYRPAAASAVRPAAGSGHQIGVTIWRLRAAPPGSGETRILVQEDAGTAEFIPERVGSATALREGDRVRLSIESPDSGYLYVIDRERYAS